MEPIYLHSYTLTSAAGVGLRAHREAIATERSGLSNDPWCDCELDTWLGRVKALDTKSLLLSDKWQSRNNRLAELGLQQDGFITAVEQAIATFGAHRCGLAVGTSTSSIGRTEAGYRTLTEDGRFPVEYRQRHIHNPHAPGAYLADRLNIRGPASTISTACSSSAKAFAAAARWLHLGLADAVVVAGVDSLCQSVIYGFNSLQLIDTEICRPFDRNRGGINLGEAAGFALLSRQVPEDNHCMLLGYGESSDAYHMSSAHPDGLGAELAMTAALEKADLGFDDIEYVNLHGTGTRTNDDIEGRLGARLFAPETLCSSTKGWTGHTLGAAGICEAILTADSLRTGVIPGNITIQSAEADLGDRLIPRTCHRSVKLAMSNSFGFGGNNCSLVLGTT